MIVREATDAEIPTVLGWTHELWGGGKPFDEYVAKIRAQMATAWGRKGYQFVLGLEGGRPTGDQPGVQPEWFYKGDGGQLVGPGQPIASPAFALDGGEAPEIAGVYLIDDGGVPVRLGFALANEFSDHVT